jgi:hypothetical protein
VMALACCNVMNNAAYIVDKEVIDVEEHEF